ncbi:Transcriptional coactivator Hfi1/Transcriptional adapter 1 [Artemisia annua]|uniref:Transcriptional coactivator Hfi1/Transcriptional adapter 1 n=1 Tax=Artemisia annua TaxID=35608 RepID=A0A2U1KT86_ARTAN|nr:Transcriptional coactivator Hfi1/Transcriptional adapter 1 [Artemisia annua]
MPAVRRVSTFELKLEIEKRVGTLQADKYFSLLTRYLSCKVKKHEFDKMCVALLGRENLRLHNELVLAIVRNTALCDIPSQKHVKSDVFLPSPRKGRTPNIRESKFKEKKRSVEEQQSATELLSLGSKPPLEVNSVEDGEEVEQGVLSPGVYSRCPVKAPLGISLQSKETRKVISSGSDSVYQTESCHYSGHLPVTSLLKSRVKHKLKTEGLDISTDCVNLLNNGLDCFLKRVIKPSLELARSRSSRRAGPSFSASMLDFRVATEINPKVLGEFAHILDEN